MSLDSRQMSMLEDKFDELCEIHPDLTDVEIEKLVIEWVESFC